MAETIVPIAAGKAAALQSFLVRRGNPRPGNRLERVKLEFERKWASAPEVIREKYASRARSGATKSEREEAMRGAGITPTPKDAGKAAPTKKPPAAPPPAAPPGPRTENPRDKKNRDTVPADPDHRERKDARSGDERGKPIPAGFAPGSDEARAAALTENSANDWANTADNGSGGDAAAAALEGKNKAEMESAWRLSQGLPSAEQEDEKRIMDAKKANPTARNPMSPTSPDPKPSPKAPAPPAAGQPPIAGPMPVAERPSSTALREAPDFTPGPGKELTGMSAGRPTYSSADSLYGKAAHVPGQRTGNRANDINQTIANTPETADSTKPVMIGSEQTIEQRRADYQTRSNTPQSQAAASNTLRTMGIQPAPETPKAPLPRGPASQPEPKYQSPIAKGGAFSDEAYASTRAAQAEGFKRQAEEAKKPTMDDVNRSFKPGTPEHTAAAWGVNAKTGEQLTKEDTKNTAPTSSRVVSSRPATAQESKDGKAREIPAIQPTPEPSAKAKPKFARR